MLYLGGLGGIPFTGTTGFGAYSHHVPEGGHCFILMAPYVGIDSLCSLGKYDRAGQAPAGVACEAAMGALCRCTANKLMPDLMAVDDDYQMSYIIHKINQAKSQILAGKDENEVQASLAYEMHQLSSTMLNKIVWLDFGGRDSTVVILTGIQINTPDPMEDYFQPLRFYVKGKRGGESIVDLFEETFSCKSTVEGGNAINEVEFSL